MWVGVHVGWRACVRVGVKRPCIWPGQPDPQRRPLAAYLVGQEQIAQLCCCGVNIWTGIITACTP